MKASHPKRERPAGVLMVVATFVVLVAVGPAAAQEPVTAEDAGWYTALAFSAGGVPIGDPIGNATFEQDDLPVGATGEGEHKRSYLRLGLPEDATSVEVELPLSEDTEKSFGQAGPILACPVTGPFAVKSGDDIESAPEVDCSVGIEGEPDADLTEGEVATMYRFDLTPLLGQWEDAEAPGSFALVADVSEPQSPYQITFVAGLLEEVGTAQADGGEAEPVVPPPDPPDSGEEPSSSDSARTPTDPLMLPQPSQEPSSEQTEGAEPPDVAAPVDETDEEDDVQAPVTQEPPNAPAMALPTPAPVRALPWIGGLLVAMAALATAGRSLRPAGHPVTSLDRMLGP